MRLSSGFVAPSAIAILSTALLSSLSGTAMSQTATGSGTPLPNVTVEAPRQVARPQRPEVTPQGSGRVAHRAGRTSRSTQTANGTPSAARGPVMAKLARLERGASSSTMVANQASDTARTLGLDAANWRGITQFSQQRAKTHSPTGTTCNARKPKCSWAGTDNDPGGTAPACWLGENFGSPQKIDTGSALESRLNGFFRPRAAPALRRASQALILAARWSRAQEEEPIMSRLALAFVWHLPRPRPTRKILSLNNRKRRPLPARMEHGRSYLMDECQVMASGRVRSPTIIFPMMALSLCHRKQASLGASDKSAHLLLSSSARCPPESLRVSKHLLLRLPFGVKADTQNEPVNALCGTRNTSLIDHIEAFCEVELADCAIANPPYALRCPKPRDDKLLRRGCRRGPGGTRRNRRRDNRAIPVRRRRYRRLRSRRPRTRRPGRATSL